MNVVTHLEAKSPKLLAEAAFFPTDLKLVMIDSTRLSAFKGKNAKSEPVANVRAREISLPFPERAQFLW